MSRNINSPHGLQIVHNPDALAFLFEQNTWFHWVPTDARVQVAGGSAGRRGTASRPATGTATRWSSRRPASTATPSWTPTGHPHSKQMKLTNTFTRTDSNTMEHTVTVHDPKTYTQDWMNVRTWRIKTYPDVIMEYSCEENNLREHRQRRDQSVEDARRPRISRR